MKVSDICRRMEEIAPLELACAWDHVGLMIGDGNAEVQGVLVCLDVTKAVLEEAVADGRNMIISHHPFIFHPLSEIDYTSPRGKLIAYAVSHGLHIYSAHTNLDYAEHGVNWALAMRLGLTDVRWDRNHHHLVGTMRATNHLQVLAARLDASVQCVVPAGITLSQEIIVGVSSGAFDGETEWCMEEGIHVLVTGEVKHSDALDLYEMPFVTVAAGHYATEIWISAALAEQLGGIAKHAVCQQAPLTSVLNA